MFSRRSAKGNLNLLPSSFLPRTPSPFRCPRCTPAACFVMCTKTAELRPCSITSLSSLLQTLDAPFRAAHLLCHFSGTRYARAVGEAIDDAHRALKRSDSVRFGALRICHFRECSVFSYVVVETIDFRLWRESSNFHSFPIIISVARLTLSTPHSSINRGPTIAVTIAPATFAILVALQIACE
jgi:hypothetical protein